MNIFNRIATGLGIGSFIYLISIILKKGILVMPKSIIFVFMISIFVSATTIIFDSEKLSFRLALIIHYSCSALFIFILDNLFWGSTSLIDFLMSMTVFYIFSYGVAQVKLKLTVKHLNERLKELNNHK